MTPRPTEHCGRGRPGYLTVRCASVGDGELGAGAPRARGGGGVRSGGHGPRCSGTVHLSGCARLARRDARCPLRPSRAPPFVFRTAWAGWVPRARSAAAGGEHAVDRSRTCQERPRQSNPSPDPTHMPRVTPRTHTPSGGGPLRARLRSGLRLKEGGHTKGCKAGGYHPRARPMPGQRVHQDVLRSPTGTNHPSPSARPRAWSPPYRPCM